MALATKIILAIIVIHLIAGFGFLIYKLTPRKGEELKSYDSDEKNTSV